MGNADEALKFAIEAVEPEKSQGAEEQHGTENEAQAEGNDGPWRSVFEIAVSGEERQGNHGQHTEAGGPQALALGIR